MILKLLKALAVFVVILCLSFLAHVIRPANTMINLQAGNYNPAGAMVSERYLKNNIGWHHSNEIFQRRIITTGAISALLAVTNWQPAYGFITVQWSFMLINALLIFALAWRLSKNYTAALWSGVLYLTSFTVFCSFFLPNDTFDEPAQYCFALIALFGLTMQQRLLGYIVTLLGLIVSCLARENSILLLPGVVLVHFMLPFFQGYGLQITPIGPHIWRFIRIALAYVPVVLAYALFRFYLFPSDSTGAGIEDRSIWFDKNFKNFNTTFEVFASWLLALSVLTTLVVLSVRHWWQSRWLPWVSAFAVTLVLNSLVVVLMTWAMETRLFSLSLLFLWPIAGVLLVAWWADFKLTWRMLWSRRPIFNVIALMVALALAWFIALRTYVVTLYPPANNYHHEALFVFILCCSYLLLASLLVKTIPWRTRLALQQS